MNKKIKSLWFIIVSALCVLSVCYGINYAPIDVNNILDNSVLKNKTFSSKIKEIKTNDISAYFMEEHSNPIVSVSFTFKKVGSAYDPSNKIGLANVVSDMLLGGAGKYNEQEFSELLDENGIKLNFSANDDDFNGYLAFPLQNKDIAIELLQLALQKPKFDKDFLALIKQHYMLALKVDAEYPDSVLKNKFREIIFAGHPYSNNTIGKNSDILSINDNDLINYIKNSFTKSNLLIGIVGDISENDANELMVNIFGKLPLTSNLNNIAPIDYENSNKIYNISFATSAQVTANFVATGVARNNDEFYPLYIANDILGGAGLTSRLFKKTREENGLTYGVYTYLVDSDKVSLIKGEFSSTPENFDKAISLIQDEWLKLGKKGVSQEELIEAKKSLISSNNLRYATISGISNMLVYMQDKRLGIDFLDKRNDYISQISLTDVNKVAKKYFSKLPDFVNIGINNGEKK